MARPTVEHPIFAWRTTRRPPLTATAVASAARIDVTSLSKVENGHRDRLNVDACRALVAAFPGELDLEQLLAWSWSKARRKKAS
jgi:hypothetical protein